MKRIIILIFTLISGIQVATSQEGIQFAEGTWAELLAKAKEENRLIFMDAYATWCGPCKKMSADVFPLKEVGNFYNAIFLPVKIDMEKGEGLALAKLYNVRAYPTLLFINWKGEVIHRAVGGQQAEGLIELGRTALDDTRNLRSMELVYRQDPGNIDKLIPYATALKQSYDMSYMALVNEYLNGRPLDELKSEKGWTLISSFVEDYKSEQFQYFLKNKQAFTDIAGQDAIHKKLDKIILTMISQAVRKKTPAAMEDLRTAIREIYPEQYPYYSAMANIPYYRAISDWENYGNAVMGLLATTPENDSQKLNSYAWDFYLNVDNQDHLKGMTKLVGEILKKEDGYAIHDTYASLLFKTKNYKQALREAKAAIVLAEKEGVPYEDTQELIKEIEKAKQK